jgi:hypothetical protein
MGPKNSRDSHDSSDGPAPEASLLAEVVLFADPPGGGGGGEPVERTVKTIGTETEVPATSTDPELRLML